MFRKKINNGENVSKKNQILLNFDKDVENYYSKNWKN